MTGIWYNDTAIMDVLRMYRWREPATGILYDDKDTLDGVRTDLTYQAFLLKLRLDRNPRDKDAHADLVLLTNDFVRFEAEETAMSLRGVTPQEHLNAMNAVSNMLAACRRAEADRLAKKQAALDALCQSMADIRIGV